MGSHAAPAGQDRFRHARPAAGPTLLLARRTFADARIRTISFACLFAVVALVNPIAYRHTYPTLAQRLAFAHSFGSNKAVVLFYGKAYDLLTVGGYSAWRTGGILAVIGAVFGLLAAVRALRGEEDTGRAELVLAGSVSRRSAYAGALLGIAGGLAVLWAATLAGSLLAQLPAAGSAYLALAPVTPALVFVGVGALTSQFAPTRRLALELGGAVVALAFLLRTVADTSASAGWLRWATPLGWAEELRPFTGAHALVLLLPLATTALLLAAAARLAAQRDLGAGLLASRDEARPHLYLLSSPTAQALRSERTGLVVWLWGVGVFALIVGVISRSISSAGISHQLEQQLAKLGSGPVTSPRGYISFTFIFFVLVLSLFSCSQMAAARHEEAEERLETLMALPVSRRNWLGGRLLLATGAAIVIALLCGLLVWLGAVSQGVDVSLGRMLEAGANCLPASLLFLGIAALAYSVLPRASAGIAYGLVTVTFLWQLLGSLLGAPKWLVRLTPYAHVAAIPDQAFRAVPAAAMLAIGLGCAVAALIAFERRDLTGA